MTWNVNGLLTAPVTGADGGRPIPGSTILAVYMSLRDSGSAGTTIVDIDRGPGPVNPTVPYTVVFSTIYTTTANRPTLAAAANANRTVKAADPDVVSLNPGDVLRMNVNQIATGAQDLTVVVMLGRPAV